MTLQVFSYFAMCVSVLNNVWSAGLYLKTWRGTQRPVVSLMCVCHVWCAPVLNSEGVLGSRLWNTLCTAASRMGFYNDMTDMFFILLSYLKLHWPTGIEILMLFEHQIIFIQMNQKVGPATCFTLHLKLGEWSYLQYLRSSCLSVSVTYRVCKSLIFMW